MKKYRYKPEVGFSENTIVEAAQFKTLKDGEILNISIIILRFYEGILNCRECGPGSIHGVIDTTEGLMIVHPGDMVVKEADGELWPWSRESFDRTFVEDKPSSSCVFR